jgi:hypothetical protein
LALLVVLLWIGIVVAYFFPWQYTFDGNLLVKTMSFTYKGSDEKLFLNNLENINTFDLQGNQSLTLTGKFSSPNSALSSKLNKLNKLHIQLPNITSRFILAPVLKQNQTSALSASNLRIYSNNRIQNLTYQANPDQLAFCIQSPSPADACEFPENIIKTDPKHIGHLELDLGQQKLQIKLGQFKSPELGNMDEVSFEFLPSIAELQLDLFSPTQLYIDLPDLAKIPSSKPNTLSEIIWGDLDVSDVKFFQFKRKINITDEQKNSTILEGKIRMGRQVMELQSDQFLIIPPKEPGISKLSYIRLSTKTPKGLHTSFTGKSKSIAAGLYPQFPVQEIKPSLLSKFPQEGISALLSFLAALTGMLLPRLLPEPANKEKPKNPRQPRPSSRRWKRR